MTSSFATKTVLRFPSPLVIPPGQAAQVIAEVTAAGGTSYTTRSLFDPRENCRSSCGIRGLIAILVIAALLTGVGLAVPDLLRNGRNICDPRNNCLQLRRRGRWRLVIELDSVASLGFSGGERRAGWNYRSDRVARGSRWRNGGITQRQFETTGNALWP